MGDLRWQVRFLTLGNYACVGKQVMRITQNVSWQELDESLSDSLRPTSTRQGLRFRHAVNLYRPAGCATLGNDQLVTAETMRLARRFAEVVDGGPAVSHMAVHDASDSDVIPTDFESGRLLQRTMCDLPGFENGPLLPFLFDILEAAVHGVGSEPEPTHLIFTNADICLQPNFYVFVQQAISTGFDSLVINRRTIANSAMDLPAAISGVDFGEPHPGLDCFVFPFDWVQGFVTCDACVGAGFVMRSLLHNLVARAEALLVVADAHLTFHFGDDRPWQSDAFTRYATHNRQQGDMVHDLLSIDSQAAFRLDAFHQVKPKYRPLSTLPKDR